MWWVYRIGNATLSLGTMSGSCLKIPLMLKSVHRIDLLNGFVLLSKKPAEVLAVYATSTKYTSFLQSPFDQRSPAPHPLSLPLNRTACPYFCSFVISPSPCLTTSAYCLFLSSGLFVSIILLTRSMVQGMRSAAMNFARSLD